MWNEQTNFKILHTVLVYFVSKDLIKKIFLQIYGLTFAKDLYQSNNSKFDSNSGIVQYILLNSHHLKVIVSVKV